MVSEPRGRSLLRARDGLDQRATSMELFFDLVYVFAVTQLSHFLLDHLSVRGALQTLLLLVAVWWAWIDTAWVTNWFDPDRRAVRTMLIGVMLASLIVSATLPEAFGGRGLAFAAAYVTMQVGRCLFVVLAAPGERALRRNFQRILVWTTASGALWLAGGVAPGAARDGLWLAAVVIDSVAPAVGFVTPGLGRSTTRDWNISGALLAERCRLFLIVALGESILVIGGTFGELAYSPPALAALVVAFLGSVALWWIYFDRTAEAAGETIAAAADPGRLGRSAYTYFHLPMVAGVIAAAAGDELVIAHPTGRADPTTIAAVLGGPALFLAGHALFKLATFGRLSVPRLVAIVALAAVAVVGAEAPPLLVATTATLIVAAVVLWDARAGHRSAAAPAPSRVPSR